MSIPKAPEDTELRNIIDKLANFVARNGPEFSNVIKTKQKDNPKFSFLFGGDYYDYYMYKLSTEQISTGVQQSNASTVLPTQSSSHPPPGLPIPPFTPMQIEAQLQTLQNQIQTLKDQIQQSEMNLNAQKDVMNANRKSQIDEAIKYSRLEKMNQLLIQSNIDVNEFESILKNVIDLCTKEAIANGKNFILNNNQSDKHLEAIFMFLLNKVTNKDATSDARLHLIYLISDVLHHSNKKSIWNLKQEIEQFIVPIFCFSFERMDEERKNKLNKLIELWNKNNYFSKSTLEKLRNPLMGLEFYQSHVLNENMNIVGLVDQDIDEKLKKLEQQHYDYSSHVEGQINSFQQQLQTLQQMKATMINLPPPPPGFSIPPPASTMNIPPPPFLNQPPLINQQQQQQMHLFMQQFMQQPPPFIPQSPQQQPQQQQQQQQAGSKPKPLMSLNPFNNPSPQQQQPSPTPPQQLMQQFGNGNNGGFPSSSVNAPMPLLSQNVTPSPNLLMSQSLDFSKPPPGFPGSSNQVTTTIASLNTPPITTQSPQPLMQQTPTKMSAGPNEGSSEIPYYNLPAALMVFLVKHDDFNYQPIDPNDMKLMPPQMPSEKLCKAVEAFYAPPNADNQRNSDGWERYGLYEFYKSKLKERLLKGGRLDSRRNIAKEQKSRGRNTSTYSSSSSSSSSRSSSSSSSRSSSRSRSRSRSKRSRSKSRSRSRSSHRYQSRRSRSRSASPAPISFQTTPVVMTQEKIDQSNKGHQLLQKMGWSGSAGLGRNEQGIVNPIEGGEVRDRVDMFKGVGASTAFSDPFEQFRRNRSHTYIQRIRERDEERDKRRSGGFQKDKS